MDIEKTMQFMLDMQARHEAAVQKHDEAIRQLDERLDRVSGLVEANTGRIGQLVDVCMSLTHHGEETDRRIQETNRLIRELRDAQTGTDYKLNALIDTVDKLVKHNGRRE